MYRKFYVIFFCVLICVLNTAKTSGQRVPDQFRFEHITVDQGLSHSDAMSVAQDKAGFVWVGTNKGIDRYDGYKIKKYDLSINEQTGISSNRIRTLHTTGSGALWVGVERAGLYWYDAAYDRFTGIAKIHGAARFPQFVRQLSQTNVLAITSDRHNRVWVATRQYGVFALQTDQEGKIVDIRRIRLTNSGEDPVVNKLAADGQENIWIGTLGEGLWVYKNQYSASEKLLKHASKVNFPFPNIRALHVDRRGDLWIGGENQVLWVNKAGLSMGADINYHKINRTFALIESLFLDSANRLWISTRYGLLLVNGSTPAQHVPPVDLNEIHTFLPLDTDPFSINSVRVHDMLEDRFHNLWFATSAGGLNLLKLRAKPFGHLRRQVTGQSTPADNYINAICEDEENKKLWIGTRNGFASYDLQTKTYRNYLSRQLSGSENGIDVSTIFKASNGTLWIGTRYGGLYTLDHREGSTLKSLPIIPEAMTWRGISIENILEDKDGTIWVASFNAGIHTFNLAGQYLKTFDNKNKTLPTEQFTALCYDSSSSTLWASTRDVGLLKMQILRGNLRLLKQFKHEPGNANSLRINYTWPLVKDRKNSLWIGTIGGGLHKLEKDPNGNEVIVRYHQWVPETDIESMLTDDNGNLWIGGAGLYKFNPDTKRIFYYDVSDGLQSNSFKIGAAFKARSGTMYFGGTNGITYFDPGKITPNSFPPTVRITEFRILNEIVGIGKTVNGRILLKKSLSEVQNIRIKPQENDFAIEFTALNYANPQKQHYAYKLKGYNDEWIETTSGQRLATFSNLPNGEYTFLVKASNDDGIWSDKPATLHFTILPPWYKSWWAYLLYVLMIGGALLLYRHVEMTQQALKNKLLMETYKVEKEKELTDTKLKFFTNVSHELRTPLTLILGPMEELAFSGNDTFRNVREKVTLMHQQTRKLLDLVNQLMDFRKVESGHVSLRANNSNVMDLIKEIFLIFKLKTDELNIDYAMEAPSDELVLYFDRDKLEIILTNLLSNAIKFTPEGGKIRLLVSVAGSAEYPAMIEDGVLRDNYLQLVVRDWGRGMQPDELDKIFDPYYQASHTDTIRMMGTGIGLSLVKQFVQAHLGEVIVHSKPGEGSTFTVKLPFGKAHLSPQNIVDNMNKIDVYSQPGENADLPAHQGSDNRNLPVRPSRILIVEDNEEVRKYLSNLFSPAFTVFTAVDGIDGWEKALGNLPDIIVSDIMMPRSDGLELCKKIKQHPKTFHIPVVLLTARAAAAHELEGLETGADEYMIKPFHPKVLYTKVVVMLHGRDRLREYYQRQILLEPNDIVIPDAEKHLLEKAMAIVEANLTNPEFNVMYLVREMGMSQSTFYRHIKAISGQSVVEFISDIRIKRAAQLLATTTFRIIEVANMVGFEDIKHFRKTFQNLYSVTPSEYVKRHRKSDT